MPPPAQTYLPPTGISPMTEFDIAQFVSAITAQLPQVQDSSPQGSVHTGPSPNGRTDPHHQRHTPKNAGEEGKIVKLTWWRPHGQTAIAPGAYLALTWNVAGIYRLLVYHLWISLLTHRPEAIYAENPRRDTTRDLAERSPQQSFCQYRLRARRSHHRGWNAQYTNHARPPCCFHDTLWLAVPMYRSEGHGGKDSCSDGIEFPAQLYSRSSCEVSNSSSVHTG